MKAAGRNEKGTDQGIYQDKISPAPPMEASDHLLRPWFQFRQSSLEHFQALRTTQSCLSAFPLSCSQVFIFETNTPLQGLGLGPAWGEQREEVQSPFLLPRQGMRRCKRPKWWEAN